MQGVPPLYVTAEQAALVCVYITTRSNICWGTQWCS